MIIPEVNELKIEYLFFLRRRMVDRRAIPPVIIARVAPGIKKLLKIVPSNCVTGGALKSAISAIPPNMAVRARKPVRPPRIYPKIGLIVFKIYLLIKT